MYRFSILIWFLLVISGCGTTTPTEPSDTTAPSAPPALVATVISSFRIDLAWNSSSDNVGVAGYIVYRDGTVLDTTAATVYPDQGLAPTTAYSYTVSAYDAAGNESAMSNGATATTESDVDTTAPSVPVGLAATAVSTSQIDLSWTASTDAVGVAGYIVLRDGLVVDSVAGPSHSDTGLAVATTYSYTVQAYDAAGNASAASAGASATTLATPDTEAPSVPAGLTATVISSSQIDLSWNASTDNVGVAGYVVYRDGNVVDTTTTTTYSDNGLAASTAYTYAVSAHDGSGNESAASTNAAATTQASADNTAPSVPAGLGATVISSSQITVSWSASTDDVGVAGYVVYRDGNIVDSTSTTTYSDGGLAASTTYSYAVSAYDAAGNESAVSGNVNATTLAGAANSCASATTLCVDDTVGATQEHATIGAAVAAAGPGDTVLVHTGIYDGFTVNNSGTAMAQLVIMTDGSGVVIDSPGPSGDGIRLQNVSYVTIRGFNIQDPTLRCIAARGALATVPMRGNTVSGNSCIRSGSEGIYLSEFADGLVENNTITQTGQVNTDRPHGLYLANGGSDNTIIRGNVIFGFDGDNAQGIHINGDLSIGGDGIANDILIERNLIFDTPVNGISMDGVQRVTIQNNVIFNTGRHSVRAFRIDGAAGPKDLAFINNTFVSGTGSGWSIKITGDEGGHTFFNNVFLGSSGSVVVETTDFASAHNVVTNSFSLDGEASVISLSAWQAAGFGLNSFIESAGNLFVDSGGDDYLLKVGSPAIDAGLATFNSINAPAFDFAGVARPQGMGHDVGAHERQ